MAATRPGTKFSSLTDINTSNVSRLAVAWEWTTGEKALEEFGTRPGNFQTTPLMIDNVLYFSTPYNRVVALNAHTGAQLWSFDPKAYEDGQPPNGTGFVHRGVAAWRDSANGNALRIFINSRYRLFAIDAQTGRPVDSFGSHGAIDLSEGLVWAINKKHYTNTSPPVVYKDLIILGNGVGDRLVYRNDPPGDIRAFNARTGRQMWSFHTIPQPGEHGNDTWGADSWSFTGHTNAWAPMTLDAERGLLYVPLGTPSNDFYGGRRPGANLFAESLVCLDANTGARKWHYQLIHHGLWDYDNPSPPNLVTITVDGRRIDAVVQLTKQGLAFVFDRVTGQPVWPIEERPVPASDVEGEQAWPTQPFPTRPPAFSEQGVTLDDAFDLTPELKAAAQAELKKYRIGPLFTPPSLQGTVQRPGLIGGANWGGAAFDTSAGVLFFKTTNQANVARVGKPDRSSANPRASEVDAEFTRVRRHERRVHERHSAAQAAVRPSGGAGSQSGRDQVARAVWRHACAAPPSRPGGRRAAACAGRARRPGCAGNGRRARVCRRWRRGVSCGQRGVWRRIVEVRAAAARECHAHDVSFSQRTAVRGDCDWWRGRRGACRVRAAGCRSG